MLRYFALPLPARSLRAVVGCSLAALVAAMACSDASGGDPGTASGGSGGSGAAGDGSAGMAGSGATSGTGGSGGGFDSGMGDGAINPDAACAVANERAEAKFLPVDIIWVVDNSVSMAPAISELTAGLNNFANVISGKQFDYRVIMLSLRVQGQVQVDGNPRFGVCIPEPLAGANCADNAPTFYQVDVDIRSTQAMEQFLGTLAQTQCYKEGDVCFNQEYGGPPWLDKLRADATKTIVFVTDHDQRLGSATGNCSNTAPPFTIESFETYPGDKNPFNCNASDERAIGPGIKNAMYGGQFDNFTVHGLYGWGSDTDESVTCTYPGGAMPPDPGETITHYVKKTGGVRAKICDGASAWGPFLEQVASAVETTAEISCELDIPEPSMGSVDPGRVNVNIVGSATTGVFKVGDAGDCDQDGGWYYDDDNNPTRVILCPASCDLAKDQVTSGGGGVDVLFGCETIVK